MAIWNRGIQSLSWLLLGAGLTTGFAASQAIAQPVPGPSEAETADEMREIYIAPLQPLNANVTGAEPIGLATFIIRGDEMGIYVIAEGLPPGMAHLQHYHGFTEGGEAECPTEAADTNSDGVVDLIETQATAGRTLVPFHDDPASLEGLLATDRFPTATNGVIDYRETVSVQALESSLQSQYAIDDLSLDERVVFLHGVGPDTNLPDSAQSIADVPAGTTLPIACGEIVRVD